MPQGFKVAIGFQSYDLTRIANVRVADMVLAEASFPGCGIERTMPFFCSKPPHQLSVFRTHLTELNALWTFLRRPNLTGPDGRFIRVWALVGCPTR